VAPYVLQGYFRSLLNSLHMEWTPLQSQSKSFLTDDGQSASHSSCQGSILVPRPLFLSLPWKLSWHLRLFQYGAPYLTRGWVCNLWLLLGCTSAVYLGVRVPRNSWPYFTVSTRKPLQLGEAGFCICCADPATAPYVQRLALISPTSVCQSVGILRLQTVGHGMFCIVCAYAARPTTADAVSVRFSNEYWHS
jgi:hypothetical protein